MTNADRRAPTLEDIEVHETARWLDEQLDRIEALVREHGGDNDMLEAISYVRDENGQWVTSDVEELERAGLLTLSDDGAAHH